MEINLKQKLKIEVKGYYSYKADFDFIGKSIYLIPAFYLIANVNFS